MEDKNRFELKKLSSISKWDSLYEKTKQIYASPIYLEATVEHGFKRGSKDLGIPTANMSMSQLGNDGESLKTGIYFGYSCIKGKVYESVTSVGWNPYFKNEKKTVEVHILSKLDDFYDENIITLLCGYLREEADFDSLDDLITCIHRDIELTKFYLGDNKDLVKYADLNHRIWHSKDRDNRISKL